MKRSRLWRFAFLFCIIGIACLVPAARVQAQTTPPVVSSLCGPSSPPPAAISGSTGAQGVLDSTHAADDAAGLGWPSTAAVANIFLDTGQVVFTDASVTPTVVATKTLPGVSEFLASPNRELNFTSVRVGAGKAVTIFATASSAAAFTRPLGVGPPALR